ncbi:MAG TPA: fibronectin type III domain-containing protein [Jatrophihabitans sp.]|nr:fibronectin type III domain-containing protein [Jatrophihabitans sp.]
MSGSSGPKRAWRLATVLPAILTTLIGVTAVSVVRSLPVPSRAASFANRSPLGAVDYLGSRPGGVRAVGWDFDPDAKRTALRTTATVDGTRVASTTADLERTDVATDYPRAGANHGFDFFVPVPEGKHAVCIRAKNIDKGSDFSIRCVTRTFDYGPFGSIDTLTAARGHLNVKGWAIDADQPKTAVKIVVTIDSLASPTITANKFRQDVADKHHTAGGNHGFVASIVMSQGTHQVCVTAKNIGIGTDNRLGCKTVTLNDSPVGALEAAVSRSGKLHVVGWTYDRSAPTVALNVTIKVDGTAHSVLANVARADVARKHPVAGKNHGFVADYTVREGSHKVCVTAHDLGYGSDVTFPCRTGVLNFTPTATITALTAETTGATLRGWARDPDTKAPIDVSITADGHAVKTITAGRAGKTHDGHNFLLYVPLKSGTHRVCAVGLNVVYGTHNSAPACRTITLALRPIGAFGSLKRGSDPDNLVVTGWTLDPDTTLPIKVEVQLDGNPPRTVLANVDRPDVAKVYRRFGPNHGISVVLKAAGQGEHTVCLTALNVDGGSDRSLGCKLIIAVNPVAPSAPRNVAAIAGYGGAEVTWSRPRSDGGAPWTKYTVVAHPGGRSITVGSGTTTATVTGLASRTTYYFTVRAVNVAGTSAAGTSPKVKTQANPPPQTTPAPVSTSRYIRNIYGASDTDRAKMRREGAHDAYYNPSGHGYLVLLDIGGQDQVNGGVVLSATTRFVSYGDLVADLKAYAAGYHSKQRKSAPVTIAIGTNNDMDVSYGSGKAWATKVVKPLVTYVHNHFIGITVAGANDIEPGFRATYRHTKAWLSGYLSATQAPFVFNGSADGCSWTAINGGCNNGWRMTGLYRLAAGAAPVRMLNLPQIYNTTMASQWKYISLTGVAAGSPRIHFGGPLTEWTACKQANSCGSLTGRTAWSTLWNNLQSDRRLKVKSLPYSTDLRIDS